MAEQPQMGLSVSTQWERSLAGRKHELEAADPSGTTRSPTEDRCSRTFYKRKVELEIDAVTDDDAAGFERHIPGQAPVAPLQAT